MFEIRGSNACIKQKLNYSSIGEPDVKMKEVGFGLLPLAISGDFIPSNTIIRSAYKEVIKSKCKRYKHAAVIFNKSQIICTTYNIQRKTHPYGSGPHGTVHAEVRAIVKALRLYDSLNGLKIFIMRMGKNGEFKPSKPCIDCIKLIKTHNLEAAWTDGIADYDDISVEAIERLKRNYGINNVTNSRRTK